jgi:GT2 family glycosyltransferase
MKLSIVIICWNDLKVIKDALRSIFAETKALEFEVIISDNGSTDGSVEYVRQHFDYPNLRIVENKANLGFARGNNAGIAAAVGDYILILNPDTIIHGRALEKLVAFADQHPEAGAFGCKVLNTDGTYQYTAKLFPTVWRFWIDALGLKWLGHLSKVFASRSYPGWHGDTEREIDWQSGCCVMFRGALLKKIGGFDPQFFYHCEEVDLCQRVWKEGYFILFTPSARITHLGGQSVKRAPTRFEIETYRNLYRYFYKNCGPEAARSIRWPILANLLFRSVAYGLRNLLYSPVGAKEEQETRKVLLKWHYQVDPVNFVTTGQEPDLGYEPLVPRPKPVPAPIPKVTTN